MVIQYRESRPASGSDKHFQGTAQKRKKSQCCRLSLAYERKPKHIHAEGPC